MLSDAAQAVIDLITRRDHVTFVEIERVLAPSMPTHGAYAWELGSYPNLILWADMSEEFLAVLTSSAP